MKIRKHCYHSFIFFLLAVFMVFNFIPVSTSANDSSIVDLWGQLEVEGHEIKNQHGQAVALHGMSLFWSQWIGKYYNKSCIKWLRDDWQCTVVWAALGVEPDGYLANPDREKAKVTAVIDACIELGLYVIIDWHDHHAHEHEAESIAFFKEIATSYGDEPNIIYEIYNEPEQVSWTNVIKPYAQEVINEIRAIDPDNIIIVGTPTWSQDVDVAARDPLDFTNIAYALHYYAASHKQFLREKAETALNRDVALFVSEYGTCEYTGSGIIDYTEVTIWLQFMDDNKLSWCNWSVADKNETSAALKGGASACGNWASSDLSESGTLVREAIISRNEPIFTTVEESEHGYNEVESDRIQNYPNPFNSSTHFLFSVPSPQRVRIDIYNILGEKVALLLDRHMHAGIFHVPFYADFLSSGTYFYTFETENRSLKKRMQLIK